MFKIFLSLHVNELNKHLFILYDFAYVIFCSYQIQYTYMMVCITENILFFYFQPYFDTCNNTDMFISV